ncbi:protein DBF4 homolog A isoform X3 [Phyllostomus hastatus]|uniref:protein DBF4 homolog A isoform X3 n=1 Tax=Phyllostomus hastatus TaxID=9423 RepID=UPI001E681DAE|nr:protein DBF4 homolog A isoform X3 [Phyllostomus hastatus]
MNSGAMRIHSKGHFQGGIQLKNEKNRPSLKSLKTDNKPEKAKYKPLWGKVFYIDLPSVTISEKLQKDIKDLGGRVEEFLSKDISYLISNKKEAKFAQTFGRISPVPSPESAYTAETTSPHPSHDGSSFKSPESVCLSRGKLLVEKAIKDHDFIPSNSILSNALSWGVKILHIDDIRYYIEQKKKELYLLKKSSTSVRDVHLLTEEHRNFAQSNHYQVVDNIISKLVFDFVECERGMPKKKRLKCNLGSFSPVTANILKKSQPKERLELQPTSQKDFRKNNVQVLEQSFQYKEPQQPEEKLVFTSEHITYPSNELRELDKETANKCSMLNPAENDIKHNFTHLPPDKNEQGCILDVSKHKLIVSENNLEEVRTDHSPCRLQTSIQVSDFIMDNSTSQPKQKSDTVLLPAKDLKEKDLHSIFAHDSGLLAISSSREHLPVQANTPFQSRPEESNECDIKSKDSLPSGKLCRKVKILLGRNKKENLEPNVELDKKRTECLTTQEENRICSSQSLLNLFQTSEEKSEFLGFTSYTENSSIGDVFHICGEEDSNSLLSVFSSSLSTSTFTGF